MRASRASRRPRVRANLKADEPVVDRISRPHEHPSRGRIVLSPINRRRKIRTMRVATGKVVAGKVILEGAPFEEGASVTVIAADESEPFELSPEEEAELLEAIGQIDRGEFVDGSELLRSLKRRA